MVVRPTLLGLQAPGGHRPRNGEPAAQARRRPRRRGLNGEIYNFRELRDELTAKGHRFRTKGDVEVFLRLYADCGMAAFARLQGMFAFALWDAPRRRFFWGATASGSSLSSSRAAGAGRLCLELSTLLAGGFPESHDIDRLELRHYLWQKYTSPAGSILSGVKQVPPGHVIEFGPEGERVTAYWQPPAEPMEDPGDDEAEETRRRAAPSSS